MRRRAQMAKMQEETRPRAGVQTSEASRQRFGHTCHNHKCTCPLMQEGLSRNLSHRRTHTSVRRCKYKTPHVVSKSKSMKTASKGSRDTGQTHASARTRRKTTWPSGPCARDPKLGTTWKAQHTAVRAGCYNQGQKACKDSKSRIHTQTRTLAWCGKYLQILWHTDNTVCVEAGNKAGRAMSLTKKACSEARTGSWNNVNWTKRETPLDKHQNNTKNCALWFVYFSFSSLFLYFPNFRYEVWINFKAHK